jgi:hypothetical protein
MILFESPPPSEYTNSIELYRTNPNDSPLCTRHVFDLMWVLMRTLCAVVCGLLLACDCDTDWSCPNQTLLAKVKDGLWQCNEVLRRNDPIQFPTASAKLANKNNHYRSNRINREAAARKEAAGLRRRFNENRRRRDHGLSPLPVCIDLPGKWRPSGWFSEWHCERTCSQSGKVCGASGTVACDWSVP